MFFNDATRFAVFAIGLLLGHTAFGQTRYACKLADGRYVASERPCPSSGGVTYYGPQQQTPSYTSNVPRTPDAPEYLKYMSARCSSLHDAIRTSASRGLTAATVEETRKHYQHDCASDESEAQAQFASEPRDAAGAKKEAGKAADLGRKQAQEKEQQCGESKRILYTKRARTDLTEGEKSDLKRFEDNYKARCA